MTTISITAIIAAGVVVAGHVIPEIQAAAVLFGFNRALAVDAAGAGGRRGRARFGGAGHVAEECAAGGFAFVGTDILVAGFIYAAGAACSSAGA